MDIKDEIYRATRIDEPVLVELIESAPLQRLNGVTMGGITAILGISPSTTRYEHSVGAMLLVRQLGASIEEQVAALLHDVSHTAFSHVIDYAFDRASAQDFHDGEKLNFVLDTEIPTICERYGIDVNIVLDEKRHALLEQPQPRLCADRVDYTLRDLQPLSIASSPDAAALATKLTTCNGRMAFTDIDAAATFGKAYLACAAISWSNPRNIALYELCGRALRLAFELGVIGKRDIWDTDVDLWLKLQNAAIQHRSIAVLMSMLVPGAEFVQTTKEEGRIEARTKIRWVDPEVLVDGGIVPLSMLSAEYDDLVSAYRHGQSNVFHLRIA